MALTKAKLIADGVIVAANLHASHGITSANIGENTNLYFTNARARSAISVSGNALSYNSSTGVITSNFEESPTFTGKITAGGGVQFTGGTIAAATAVLHTNNYLYLRGGTSGLIISGSDGSCNFRTTNSEVLWEIGSAERMRITSGGDLCLGVTSALGKIHMHSSGTSYLHISNNTTGSGAGSGTDIGVFTGQSDLQINNREAASVIISTSDTPRLTISSGGNATFAGKVNINDNGGLYLNVNSATQSDIAVFKNNNGSIVLGYTSNLASIDLGSSQAIRIRQGGNVPFTIATDGRIGIGTTSPSATLTVKASTNNSSDILRLRTSDNYGYNFVRSHITGFLEISGNQSNANGYVFKTNTTAALTIANNANATFAGVIHTTKDGGAVAAISTPRIRLRTDGVIEWGATYNAGTLTWDTNKAVIAAQAGNALELKANNSTLGMVINTSGNVGIGTTAPSANLHVQNASTATLKVITTGVADASVNIQGYDAGVHIGDATNGLRWAIWNDGPSTSSSLKFGSYALGTWYNNSSQVVTMTSDGKVGIGITTPSYPLEVAGASTVSIAYQRTGVSAKKWGFHTDNSNTYWQNLTDNILALTISNDGKVGIGTTSPNAGVKLEVNGIISANGDQSPTGGGLGFGDYQTGGYKWIQSFESQELRINPLGNNVLFPASKVAIGTTSAAAGSQLTVNAGSSAGITISTGSNSGECFINFADAADANVGQIFYGHTDNKMVFRVNDASSMTITSAGNVGIGTTSPNEKLVVGTTGGTQNIEIGNSYIQSFNRSGSPGYAALSFYGSSYTFNVGVITCNNVSGDKKIAFRRTGANNFSIEHDSSQIYFYNETTTESPLLIQNDGDVTMNAGNIGIGTTSPETKLQVHGVVGTGAAITDGNVNYSVTGFGAQDGGALHINFGLSAVTSSGDTITFTYAATSWKSWSLNYNFASTNGISKGVVGGYWNNSGGATHHNETDNLGVSVAVTHTGQGNTVTFTFTALGTHPMAHFVYMQSGGDGQPRADRVTLNAVT